MYRWSATGGWFNAAPYRQVNDVRNEKYSRLFRHRKANVVASLWRDRDVICDVNKRSGLLTTRFINSGSPTSQHDIGLWLACLRRKYAPWCSWKTSGTKERQVHIRIPKDWRSDPLVPLQKHEDVVYLHLTDGLNWSDIISRTMYVPMRFFVLTLFSYQAVQCMT